jgi:chitinase
VNQAPEQSPSGYPGTNFAGHCWEGNYFNEDNVESNLLSECYYMKQDINYCKSKGVKILLSIGGEYNKETSNYEVTSEKNGRDFAEFLYKAFGPYDPFWDGPRPFDASPTDHTSVDGFDFDIEHNFRKWTEGYIAHI